MTTPGHNQGEARAHKPHAPLVLSHHLRVALLGAELVANRLRARPRARIILPTGHTPLGMYGALRAHAAEGGLPAGQATLFQLDEYVGLGAEDERSYRAYLRRELRGIPFGAVHELDGRAEDPDAVVARHQRLLDEAPVDLVVLGLGRDGHVAFDEPGSNARSGVRRVALHPVTREDAAADFGTFDAVPTEALTVGLRTLIASREIVMLVSGAAKARALHAMLVDEAGPGCPASLIREHPRLLVVCDADAARLLPPHAGRDSDRVVVVLGHREPGRSAEHRISRESRARMRRAVRLCRRHPPRAVIFTGYSRTGGLSEAEQMEEGWILPVPPLLEDAGRDTAENATRSLPLIRAIGGIRDVRVVTSAWHLRARYFFAFYRSFDLRLSFTPARGGNWLRMLVTEIAGMRSMRRRRREAIAAIRLPPEIALGPGPADGEAVR